MQSNKRLNLQAFLVNTSFLVVGLGHHTKTRAYTVYSAQKETQQTKKWSDFL